MSIPLYHVAQIINTYQKLLQPFTVELSNRRVSFYGYLLCLPGKLFNSVPLFRKKKHFNGTKLGTN